MATATEATEATAPGEEHGPASGPEAAAPTAGPGPLAKLLTPVEPARPVRPLGTTAAMKQAADATSSKDATGNADSVKAGGRGSVVAALGHALAERIRRGGTSVKRTHTIAETRASGGTNTASSTNSAGRLAKQDGQSRTSRDAKVADLNNKVQQRHGRTGSDVKKAATTDAKSTRTKASKGDTSPKGPAAKATRPGGAKDSAAAKTPGPSTPAAAARPSGPDLAKKPDPKSPADPNGKTAATKPAGTPPGGPAKDTQTAGGTGPATPAAPAGPTLRTKPAREAGYRDGTRVAAVTGHARAYRDGALDGWDDRTATDKAEGRTMTDTRARNASRPQQKAAPKMAPAAGSTVDLAKKPAAAVPVQVTAVNDKAVAFTAAGGEQHTMSRGEVRTLKAFERRLAEKKAALGRIAERSKDTRVQAVDLASRAQRLSEDAKTVKGGDRIVALLGRLAERAQVLRGRAEDIEKNAQRGSEAVNTLAANAETRHGGIYRAVVDSPLTAPAEREFYQDKAGS